MADYAGFKANELKELLKERGIPTTGLTRKQQYIEALEKQDAESKGEGEVGEGVGQAADEQQQADVANGAENAPAETIESAPTQDAPAETGTPQVGSPAPDEGGSESRKRKRRSPTPPASAESVSKKLKAADEEELPKLPEDGEEKAVEAAAPAPVDSTPEETVRPTGVSDDVMDVTEKEQDDVMDVTEKEQDGRMDVTEKMQDDVMDVTDMEQDAAADASKHHDVEMEPEPLHAPESGHLPSAHTPTSALYIRHLLRPLQLQSLRDHLVQLASPSDLPPDHSLIRSVHLDTYKSHAFALFANPSSASRARSKLHDTIWPEETQRKPLWVDYIPEEKVEEWSAVEDAAGKSRRFEVVYSAPDSAGNVTASLEEVGGSANTGIAGGGGGGGANFNTPGPGMPNAPTGPRGDRRPSQPTPAPRTTKARPSGPDTTALESRFHSTNSQPKLFYLPVSADLVTKRLDELDKESARDWDGGRQKVQNGPLDQLRRYTFEDDYVVVDGGPDFGGFGREQGAGGGGPPPVMGGGGGYGGGGRRGGGGGGGRGGRRW